LSRSISTFLSALIIILMVAAGLLLIGAGDKMMPNWLIPIVVLIGISLCFWWAQTILGIRLFPVAIFLLFLPAVLAVSVAVYMGKTP
jgi:hypothetical protein